MKGKPRLGPRVAVVLGGGLLPDGSPWEASRLRAETAARLALIDTDMTVILSGAGRQKMSDPHALTEAAVMAKLVSAHGVERRRLLVEGDSIDTMGNAILSSARFLYGQEPRPVTVITSPFHVERAGITFTGVLGQAWHVDVVASPPASDDFTRRFAEEGGIAWTHRFLKTVPQGDLPRIVKRLFEVGKPYYKTVPILKRLARKAA